MKALTHRYLLLYFNLIALIHVSFAQLNLQNGLVAHWKLNDNLFDETIHSFHGTSLIVPNFTNSRNSLFEKCVSIDSNIIHFGDILDTVFTRNNSNFSISCWANTARVAPYKGGNMIVTKSFGGNGPYQWYINHDTDGYVYAYICFDAQANNYSVYRSNYQIQYNTWFHALLQFEGSKPDAEKVVFVVNGTPGLFIKVVGSFSDKTEDTNMPICIGGSIHPTDSSTGNHYKGLIDEVRIYNRTLTRVEMDSLAEVINTSINTHTNQHDEMTIYPNPTKDLIVISSIEALYEINVFDVAGKLVKKVYNSNTFSIRDFENGMYLIKYTTPNGLQKSAKVLKID